MYGRGICVFFMIVAVVTSYDLGVTNKYSYDTTTVVDEQCLGESGPQVVGQRLKTHVHLTVVWQDPHNPTQQLIRIVVSEPKLWISKKSTFVAHPTDQEKLSSQASFILREKGSVLGIWDDPNEASSLRNIKRGIASLLQVQKKDQDEREADVSGNCQVVYKAEGEAVKKWKSNCINSGFDRSLSQPYGVRSVSIQHLLTTDCKLSDVKSFVISSCTATEYIKAFSNVWQTPSVCINAKSEFLFEGVGPQEKTYDNKDIESVIKEIKTSSQANLENVKIEAVFATKPAKQENNIIEHIGKYQDSLRTTNLAKIKSAITFYKLLPTFRSATKEDIEEVLKNKKLKPIQGQILDLIAASATESSLQATFEYFKDVKKYDEMLERFLISLSVTPKPKEYVMAQIKSFLDEKKHDEKIHATLTSTLGAVLKTYGLHHDIANDQVLQDYRTYLEKKLNDCTSESCVIALLRSFRNAAFPRSALLLLDYAIKGGKPALEAVLAVRNIDVRLLPDGTQNKLLKVFLQSGGKQDRSTRSIAADILLDMKIEPENLKGILAALSDQTDAEFTTFLASKIIEKATSNQDLKSRILRILPEKYISYYYSLSQKGTSSLFTKPLIDAENINVTYGIQMEMLPGNLLKRSVFDVNFGLPEISNLLTVGMFAEGISSFAGDSSSEEGVDPQAGMELTLLGSALRPYVFFTGTSQLMSHAWSGTASEPTPALQGIFSFSDDERIIVLNNGLVVQVHLRGVLSTDLSASIQISLWNRNSQSQVKNAAALLMRGAVTVDTGFSTIQGAFQFSGQSAIDFSTDLEFAESPFMMCLQMEHPDITLKYDSHKSISVTGTKYSLRRTKRRKRLIPSKSYALHERNNEQCRQLK